jgi:type IV pilus assembly protein PilF
MLRIKVILMSLCLPILGANCAGNSELVKKQAKAKENLGISYIQQGNQRTGIGYLLEAARLDPEEAGIQHELALAYKDLGVHDKALFHFKKTLTLEPDFSEAWNNLGTLYLLQGKWNLAIDAFEEASLNITYKTPQFAYNNLGVAYYNKKAYDSAIESFLKAVKLSPSYTISYVNLGLTYESMNRWEEAMNAYEKAISLDPDSSMAHFGLGKIYLNLNRKAEATRELRKTKEINPGGPFAKEAGRLLSQIN